MIKAAVLTISDSCANADRQDISGQTIVDILLKNGYDVTEKKIVPDDVEKIISQLMYLSDKPEISILFTTGGTGFGPRDVTPEATMQICQKIIPGFGELIRAKGLEKTPNAVLSRGTAGIRNNTIIINLPGSPKAVTQSLELILPVLDHAVDMMLGGGH